MQKDPLLENLSTRDGERILSQFKNCDQYEINFIKQSSDIGVARNGGRRGAQFAPTCLLGQFKKLAIKNKNQFFIDREVSSNEEEIINFEKAQKSESLKISEIITSTKALKHVFIGGGHDHIYTTLIALEEIHSDKKLCIVNIDPHLDTRTDSFFNSGTPFRQFDKMAKKEFELIQIGTHDFANTISTTSSLLKGNQKIISMKELIRRTDSFCNSPKFLKDEFQNSDNTIYILSLDVDALESSVMKAVSAPNHFGIPYLFIQDIFNYFKNILHTKYYGIYEYNPVYEDLSQAGSRSISALIYELLN